MGKKKVTTLDRPELEEQGKCSQCTLKEEARVPSYGDGEGYILIVGETPGVTEVEEGRPFVGKAGGLLRRIMGEVGIDEDRVYITNSVQCRPEDNREPTPDEIRCCNGRLLWEIAKVKPKVIVALGGWAHLAVTGRAEKITKARGRPEYLDIAGKPFLSISSLHPSGLFHNPSGFPDICADLEKALDACNGINLIVKPPADKYYIVMSGKGAKSARMETLLSRLERLDIKKDILAVDIETDSLRYLGKKIISCALSWKGETAVSFDWDILRKNKTYKKRFAEILSKVSCSFHNGMFDILWLNQEDIHPRFVFDSMLASYVLDERKGVHSLDRLSISRYNAPSYKYSKEQIANAEALPRRDLLVYNATDADYTRRLTSDLPAEMDEADTKVLNKILMPAAVHFMKQTIDGMGVDQDRLEENGRIWKENIDEINEQLRGFPDAGDVNPNSPKQVSKYIYDTLRLRQMGEGRFKTIDQATLLDEIQDIEDPEAQEYWHTQSVHTFRDMSARSTSTYMLFWLAQQHDYPRLMVKHRLLSKKYGTYYKGLKEALWSDGRMRPSIKLHGTVTGRQSSSGPNIHGTPRDDMIKDTYIADDGYVLLDADFPQAEMRMIGHIAGDKRFIEVLRERDIHVTVAKKLYRLTDEEWDDLDASEVGIRRRAAKTVGFGIIYGRGAKGLAPQLGVPVEEAQMYINRLFIEVMPGVYIWIQKQKERVLIDQEVRSIYGRKRRFPLIANRSQRSEIQRMAVNMPVQSSVSDMTTLAYIKSCAKFDKIGLPYKRYSQIHDDFKIQVMKDAVKEAAAIVKSTMENDLDFETEVPFGPVEVKSGRSWGSLALVGI